MQMGGSRRLPGEGQTPHGSSDGPLERPEPVEELRGILPPALEMARPCGGLKRGQLGGDSSRRPIAAAISPGPADPSPKQPPPRAISPSAPSVRQTQGLPRARLSATGS